MWNESIVNFIQTKESKTIFSNYTNKEVSFSFKGASFSFNLSRSLFSSFDIDAGSKLLLKSIAKKIDTTNVKQIMDIGCGVGVLGLSLLPHCHKEASLICEDRNALALLYTYHNGLKNNIEANRITPRWNLFLQEAINEQVDLLVSNIPAKAGNNIIKLFLQNSISWVKPQSGVVAIVIVKPLADLAIKSVTEANIPISYREENSEYLVLHLKNPLTTKQKQISNDNYIRNFANFNLKKISYPLHSVYNLPDFDTISYNIIQLSELILSIPLFKEKKHSDKEKRSVAFINPGQGHLPLYTLAALLQENPNFDFSTLEIILYGVDYLELLITNKNIQDFLNQKKKTLSLTTKLLFQIEENEPECFIFNPTSTSLPHEIDFIINKLSDMKQKHTLLFATKSNDFTQIQKLLKSYSIIRHKKGRGYKAGHFIKK